MGRTELRTYILLTQSLFTRTTTPSPRVAAMAMLTYGTGTTRRGCVSFTDIQLPLRVSRLQMTARFLPLHQATCMNTTPPLTTYQRTLSTSDLSQTRRQNLNKVTSYLI